MLHINSITHGENRCRIMVTDLESGKSLSGIVENSVSDKIIAAISRDPYSMTLDDVSLLTGIYQKPADSKASKIRKSYGIKVDTEGNVTLPSGAVLPDSFRRMLSTVSKDRDITAVLNFGEKLVNNPLDHAREALIEWIIRNPSIAILRNGDVVGYRGLREDFTSIHSGYGIVNGEHFEYAHLDNTPGNVIEFPRSMVDHDPNNICSVGLHVGTWGYASNFGANGRKIIVTFSPEDVVSPPTDSTQEKIRVCKMVSRAEVRSALPEDRVVYELDELKSL